MNILELKCGNCGAGLPVPDNSEFVKCQFCGTAHQVERSYNGEICLTMLQAAVEKIGRDVRVVRETTDQTLNIQRSFAAKENAKIELAELKSKYRNIKEDLESEKERLEEELKENSAKALQSLMWGGGLFFVAIFTVIISAAAKVSLGFIVFLLVCGGGLCIWIGVQKFMSMRGLRASMEERERNLEIKFNKRAAELTDVLSRKINI